MNGNRGAMSSTVIAIAAAAACLAGREKQPPEPQWTVPCRVVEVTDGDTLTVEVSHRITVRLLECWAPELGQERGPQARNALQQIADGREAVLQVPLAEKQQRMFSFGRVLGRVWIDGRDVSQEMVASGYATSQKPATAATGMKKP